MKKNKMMRLASVLLVLTLLSTSVISGTFAKYVTSDSASDTARVAKWGVVATIQGDLFGQTYAAVDDVNNPNSIISYSVNDGTVSAANDTDFVVAPGTENKNGLSLSVKGTPEVASRVILDAAENEDGKDYKNSEIYLNAGTYGVMVEYTGVKTAENCGNYFVQGSGIYEQATDADLDDIWYELCDKTEATSDYYPLTWYVDGAEITGRQSEVWTELVDEFKGTFNPNETIDQSKTVGWSWAYGTKWEDIPDDNKENTVLQDQMDTVLGNMISDRLDDNRRIVALGTDGKYYDVTYQEDSSAGNTVVTAYHYQEGSSTKVTVACLTVAFNARLTVEQVD